MKVLAQASKAAHQSILAQPQDGQQRYSQFPVHELEFWQALFTLAQSPATAKHVLAEISLIEEEPCIENERVFHNVRHARNLAKLALLN